jgi:hypothetical protein
MILALLTSLASLAPVDGDLLAVGVKRAETISQGPIEHAVILIEDGKIIEIGQDLPIERGIPVLERPDWIAMPGLVSAHTRVGGARASGRTFEPQDRPNAEIDPRADHWQELLKLGVTTLGFYPGGSGIPGQAIVLQPHGSTLEEMLVREPAYLKITLQASAASKKALRQAFDKVDDYDTKVEKAREKWEKAREKEEKAKKKKKSSRSKKDDDKDDEDEKDDDKKSLALPDDDDKDEGVPKVFTPPVPDEKVKPFLDLRGQSLTAMISIRKAADYLHLLDVIEDEEDVQWFLQFPLANDRDLYEVVERIAERELLVVTEPKITLQVNTLRVRNIPAELAEAGVKLALGPRMDTLSGYEDWMPDVGRLIGEGLARETALAAVTLEPARALGMQDEFGSLDKDKTANIIFWSGDPFEPSSRVKAVMLAGEFVIGGVR